MTRSRFAGEVLLARYLKAREVSGIRPGTLRLNHILLTGFLSWLANRHITDLRRATPEDLGAYQRHLGSHRYRRTRAEAAPWKPLAPRSRYDALACVCRFFRWLVAERLLLADPSARLELGRRRPFQPSNVLTEKEAAQLLATPDTRTPIGLRDRALLELLYSTGLRRAEAEALDVTDVDLTEGIVLVRCGKGGKSRLVPLGDRAADVVRLYVEKGRPRLATSGSVAALFLSSSVGTPYAGQRLTAAGIKLRVKLTARRAGIGRHVTPHALRHSLATHLLRAGADVRHVQAILGHARVDTTEAYTHLVAEDLARAHRRSHPRGG